METIKWIKVERSETENLPAPMMQVVAQVFKLDLNRADHFSICVSLIKAMRN
jgi:hypothetical protein